MEAPFRYEVCPECGWQNPEKKSACPACDNRLTSDSKESHESYVKLVRAEHAKRLFLWFGGWTFVALVFLGPLLLAITGRTGWLSSGSAMAGAFVIGWRVMELQKKLRGSEAFLVRYENADGQ